MVLPIGDAAGAVSGILVIVAVLLLFAFALYRALWRGRKEGVDSAAEGLPSASPHDPSSVEIEPNFLALAVSVGAACLGIVSVFLPALESHAFSRIEQNSLIQSGTGFFIVGVCLAILGDSYRVYQNRTRSWGVAIGGVLLIAAAIYAATGKRVELEGTAVLTGQRLVEKASPAVGIYAAGAAGLIAVFAGYAIATNRGTLGPGQSRGLKTCPDCAETVLEDARVCKHCGHEFNNSTPADELDKLYELKERGALTEAEYEQAKGRLLDT